jgi:integrase/recombinase XerD
MDVDQQEKHPEGAYCLD